MSPRDSSKALLAVFPATATGPKTGEPRENPIVAAHTLQALLDSGVRRAQSDMAAALGSSRTRITRMMNLLKLPSEMAEFLSECDDPGILGYFTERRLSTLTGRANDKQKLDKFSGMLAEAQKKGAFAEAVHGYSKYRMWK